MSFLVKNFLGAAAPTPAAHAHAQAEAGHAAEFRNDGQVRKFLNRIQTSQIPQDRRDAISSLCDIEGAGLSTSPDDVAMLMNTTRSLLDDSEFLVKVAEFFVNITDEQAVPNDGLRYEFLKEMMDATTLLAILRDGHFWAKFNAVTIFQRLQQYDDSALVKQLLSTQGIQALIDVLNDNSNGGALRNEGLVLLSHITAINQEIQTILAFENCFDSLFGIIDDEGGVDGDVIVKDCLVVMQNMLRNNKTTQMLFMEMSAIRLTPLLTDVSPTNGELRQNGQDIVHAAVSVVACVLRCADANGEGQNARSALVHCGVVPGLVTVAFSSKDLGPMCEIEALRTLALLLQQHKPACDAFLAAKMLVKGASTVPATFMAIKAILYEGDDQTKVSSVVQIVAAFVSAGSAPAASFIVKGLAPASRRAAEFTGLNCGQLLGGTLFSPSPAHATSVYYAAWILNRCVNIPQVAEQLLSVAWENNMTFFTAYVQHVLSVLHGRKCDMATSSSLIRPLFTWIGYCSKSVVILLSNPALCNGFADWASNSREPAHMRVLAATIFAHLCLMCPPTKVGTMAVDVDGLVGYLNERGGARLLESLLYDASATMEWQGAPSDMTVSPTPVIYDVPLKQFIEGMLSAWKERFGATPQEAAEPAAPPAQPEARPEAPSAQQIDQEVRPAEEPQPNPAEAANPVRPKSTSPEAVPSVNGVAPAEAARVSPPAAAAAAAVPSAAPQVDASVMEELETLRTRLAAAEEANRVLEKEKHELTMQNEQQVRELQDKNQEATHLFEETLHTKEDELRGLVASLTALEGQLAQRQTATRQVTNLESTVRELTEDREELLILIAEMDEENQLLRSGCETSAISLAEVEQSAEKPPVAADEENLL